MNQARTTIGEEAKERDLYVRNILSLTKERLPQRVNGSLEKILKDRLALAFKEMEFKGSVEDFCDKFINGNLFRQKLTAGIGGGSFLTSIFAYLFSCNMRA